MSYAKKKPTKKNPSKSEHLTQDFVQLNVKNFQG